MNRIRELDGIRGIAIILVLIWHYIVRQACLEDGYALAYSNGGALSLTWSGVDLFFVLSGFLIVGILLDAKGSDLYFKTFYIRRICRIFPLYFLMLFLFIIIPSSGLYSNNWLFLEKLPLLSYFTFTQNFFMQSKGFGPHWLSVTWSLAIEEQFYLLIPVLVYFLSRKTLLFIFICAICLAPIFRLIYSGLGTYVLPLARADSILMGGCVAIIMKNSRARTLLIENYMYLVCGFVIFLYGAIILTFKRWGIEDVFNHFWLGGLYSLFIIISILRRKTYLSSILSSKILVWFGLRSYAIYLFHQPISSIMHKHINGSPLPAFIDFSGSIATLISLMIVLILSECSFKYYESVFLSFGKKYTANSS